MGTVHLSITTNRTIYRKNTYLFLIDRDTKLDMIL